jgi:hypothetical protein
VRSGIPLASPVVSSDGRYVAFGVHRSSGAGLYLRALASFELTEIPGGGTLPFFSPDGTSVAFFRDTELWTMSLAERVPTRVGHLAELGWDITSAAWDPGGRFLVNGARGLWSLPTRGGEPKLLVATDSAARERFVEVGVFPDGRILLGIIARAGSRTEAVSADGTQRVAIVPGFEEARIVDDILFFTQAGQARATRIDLRHLTPVGEPIALADYPSQRPGHSIAWLDGLAVRDLEPVWVDGQGFFWFVFDWLVEAIQSESAGLAGDPFSMAHDAAGQGQKLVAAGLGLMVGDDVGGGAAENDGRAG